MVILTNGTISTLVNLLTQECLDLSNGYYMDNTPVIGYGCHYQTNQQWRLSEQDFELLMIQNTLTNTYATSLDDYVDGGRAIGDTTGNVEFAQHRQLWRVTVVDAPL